MNLWSSNLVCSNTNCHCCGKEPLVEAKMSGKSVRRNRFCTASVHLPRDTRSLQRVVNMVTLLMQVMLRDIPGARPVDVTQPLTDAGRGCVRHTVGLQIVTPSPFHERGGQTKGPPGLARNEAAATHTTGTLEQKEGKGVEEAVTPECRRYVARSSSDPCTPVTGSVGIGSRGRRTPHSSVPFG